MTKVNEVDIQAKISERLSVDSYEHSLRTSDTAVHLAGIHGVDVYQAKVAGLLHDIAKDLSDAELLERARIFGLDVAEAESRKPYLLHAAIGGRLIAEDLGIADDKIISAVVKHTFGGITMDKLDKIIYLADVIEPHREFVGLEKIRELAEVDLDKAFGKAYQGQLIFIIEKGGYLHPQTIQVWNQIASEVKIESGRN